MKFVCEAFVIMLLSTSTVKGETIYISSSLGASTNSGTSISSPISDFSEAINRADTILLKAGDIFYESIVLRDQVLMRYGKGPNPVICGFKRPVSKQWQKVADNIWTICLSDSNFSGFVTHNTSEYNNIGCIYEYDKDVIHACKVNNISKLQKNWDIFQSDNPVANLKDYSRFDTLYMYHDGNPNDLKLEFSVGGHYGIKLYDSHVYNVNVKGFGIGGIHLFGTSSVHGSRVDVIGGSIMVAYPSFVCLGNGIDFWVSQDAEDCVIEDCYITRCYDCGCSIQASDRGTATPRNIVFKNNLIDYCCQGWEDFLRNDPDVIFENCRFENNIVLHAGNSGFGYSDGRFKYCNVLGNNTKGNKGMIICNNVFVGGNFYCSGAYNDKYMSNVWDDNLCYIVSGSYLLSNYHGTKDVIRVADSQDTNKVSKDTEDSAISEYREFTNDQSTKFVICSQKEVDRISRKYKKHFLKNHVY